MLPNSECSIPLNGHYVAIGLISWWVVYSFNGFNIDGSFLVFSKEDGLLFAFFFFNTVSIVTIKHVTIHTETFLSWFFLISGHFIFFNYSEIFHPKPCLGIC